MKRLKLFIPLVVFVVLAVLFWRGLSLDPSAMPSTRIGKPVPEFRLPTLEDTDRFVTQEIFVGQAHLLNVWATWCPPCYAEHGYLMHLAKQGIPIVGVNYRDDIPAAQKWLKDLSNPYVVSVIDADGRFGLDLGVFGQPETYVVDKHGIIRYKHIGVVEEKAWTQKLQPLMQSLQ